MLTEEEFEAFSAASINARKLDELIYAATGKWCKATAECRIALAKANELVDSGAPLQVVLLADTALEEAICRLEVIEARRNILEHQKAQLDAIAQGILDAASAKRCIPASTYGACAPGLPSGAAPVAA